MEYIWKLRNWNKIVIARAFEIEMSHYFSFELDLAKLEFVYYIISIDLFLTIYASISYSSINRTYISPPQILYFLIIFHGFLATNSFVIFLNDRLNSVVLNYAIKFIFYFPTFVQ